MSERATAPPDSGMTLIEVLVATALFMVLTTLITMVAILGLRTSAAMEARVDNSVQGDLGVAAAGKLLRAAVSPQQFHGIACTTTVCDDQELIEATSTCVTFYSGNSDGLTRTNLAVVDDPSSSGAILRQLSRPESSAGSLCDSDAHVTGERTVARSLVPDTNVFEYYDSDGDRLDKTVLTAADLKTVTSIELTLVTQTASGQLEDPTTTVQRIRLPNADNLYKPTEGP